MFFVGFFLYLRLFHVSYIHVLVYSKDVNRITFDNSFFVSEWIFWWGSHTLSYGWKSWLSLFWQNTDQNQTIKSTFTLVDFLSTTKISHETILRDWASWQTVSSLRLSQTPRNHWRAILGCLVSWRRLKMGSQWVRFRVRGSDFSRFRRSIEFFAIWRENFRSDICVRMFCFLPFCSSRTDIFCSLRQKKAPKRGETNNKRYN